ncbi:growth-regulating factor 3 isoform X1 [Pyrus x bretschneideri]|uniref:growth-regulating factor 3 isoform X1 n=2 Tax=Pyrus x bretschneideri TaxID=225117 RepID=UPI000510C296|nr:growth-regulating factor 3 isoform X1 [Pyrus x bretschneideri]XP_048424136.1 growth-regulating factor 3 isoform X1 [Pyrus x bretschneideri]XP_048424137.1 growth-regulating factor 3 isoform X1 [Pyrus x bretschneideri]
MDFHLEQWRTQQHESEEQHSAKIPKLDLDPLQNAELPSAAGYALPLFVPEPNTKILSAAFSESSPATSRFPKMGSYFSLSQWQELELQALIFRYMVAGAAVPPELLQPIKKSLLHSAPYFLHHPLQQFPHFQPALLQSGYWGRAAMDPEPTRCRRTDGKKWRCSRDVVAGQKYCERHVHRGRNRSRKPVEVATTTTAATTTAGGGGSGTSLNNVTTITNTSASGTHFALSGSSSSPSIDLLHLNQSSSEAKPENRSLFEPRGEVSASAKSDSHVLRPFFDDWPGKLQELDNARSNASSMNSATSLSISIRGTTSSDVSLKLSTGNGVEPGHQDSHAERGQPQLNWPAGWATNQMASMGGPLAEALRSSSNSNSSPTSVLHRLPRGPASEASFIST